MPISYPECQIPIKLDTKYAIPAKNISKLQHGGVKIKDLKNDHGLKFKNLNIFIPPSYQEISNNNIEVHYLGYYLKWIPQETFYYAVENCGFRPRPFRSDGTYGKYSSIDDKIDDLNFYTMFIKFGIGRATADASTEIRNNE